MTRTAVADHTPDPTSVAIAGDLQSELGCTGGGDNGDWMPECANTELTYDAADTVWQGTFTVPAGSWLYKAALNDTWTESYGLNGGNDDIPLNIGSEASVKFYYSHKTHWITDNVNSEIATAVGSFQDALGCPGDAENPGNWQPDCLASWMQDVDGNDIYTFVTTDIPAGTYEYKVAINEGWDENYGVDGVPGGDNTFFTVNADGDTVTFSWDSLTKVPTVNVESTEPPDDPEWMVAGDFQSEAGCPGDWDFDCAQTGMADPDGDGVFRYVAAGIPAANYEYKVFAFNNTSIGFPGSNVALTADGGQVRWYFQPGPNRVADNMNQCIVTVAGDFQSELGGSDFTPSNLRTMMWQESSGSDWYSLTVTIPAGDWQYKFAHDEDWSGAYPPGFDNLSLNLTAATEVTFRYNCDTNENELIVPETGDGLEDGDELLVTAPLRQPGADEFIYFVMTDRFANGDTANDKGGSTSNDPYVHGFWPEDKGFHHGGDLAGLMDKLPYLDDLGVTALWITPPFTNRWVQGDTPANTSSSYHGYWQIDLTQIDPHLGTNQNMIDLVDAAHDLGIKVYFDIVINHTGDVIQYVGGETDYRNKTDYPYTDAEGNEFDDRDHAGTGSFPPLDAATSFPYEPTFAAGDEDIKAPAWLNDPIYYHNRGNSTFNGENDQYGDFFGLDDLFTEHPDVVDGMIDAHNDMISTFGIDGFRIDTVKHVNDEFWEEFVPAVLDHATSEGNPDFAIFGEVFSGDAGYLSRFTTALPLPSVLDFRFDGAVKSVVAQNNPTNGLTHLFNEDNWFTDANSNAYGLTKFVGNHDIGRVGRDIVNNNGGAGDANWLARAIMVQALNLTTRGVPVIYYGDEQGFTGDGGDKDARQDMFPSLVDDYNDDDLIGTTATTADDNFDQAHPLYMAISELAGLRAAHPALRTGAQIHRFGEDSAGIYAFSRIDRDEQVEYIVAINTSGAADSATIATDSPSTSFTELYPGGGAAITPGANGQVTLNVPALGVVIYQADAAVATDTEADGILINQPDDGAEVTGRVHVSANVTPGTYAEVTFAVSIDGGDYEVIGVDDNAPYGIYHDVSGLAGGTSLTYKAIVRDLGDNLNADKVTVTVGEAGSELSQPYAIIHYNRPGGDYGDHTTGNSNNFWGLHLWEDVDESGITWTTPKPFLGEDEYGRFAWVRLKPGADNVGFIVHKGGDKDGTDSDRFFDPSETPEIWLKQGDATNYTSQAAAQGYATVHYHRDDNNYTGWGLYLWGDGLANDEGTVWGTPLLPHGDDDFGVYWNIPLSDVAAVLNFIVYDGTNKDPDADLAFTPADDASVWVMSGDATVYAEKGGALGYATFHYHRPAGDYGVYESESFNDYWGLHTWGDAEETDWDNPRKPNRFDVFGPVWDVPLIGAETTIGYIFHKGGTKDPGPDQSLNVTEVGYEVWQLQGANPEYPFLLPLGGGTTGGGSGRLDQQKAYWVSENTILWPAATDPSADYFLYYAPDGGLALSMEGIDPGTDGGSIELTRGTANPAIFDKFPHLAGMQALKITGAANLALVPELLKGQIAVGMSKDGARVDATGLQIPGVLDDLYAYDGELGVSWDGDTPTIRVWAPTAQSVTFKLFDDSGEATTSADTPMTLDAATGVWSIIGDSSWKYKFYLFDVEVFVNATGAVENNVVTDPYSFSLSTNSARSQIVDLSDPALKPEGWDELTKPPLAAPEAITVYELHVRDFSVNDLSVPEVYRGTFTAFTLGDTAGVDHLIALAEAGLSHLHLLPVFDIATINENKDEWQEPDPAVLATYPPNSEEQQAAIAAVEDLDGFNWGYDPFHYTVPEGSYSTNPDGVQRIIEFREMIQELNEDIGLRVVMDVVYNHTNAAGQAEKSVLDRIVPGYYHRLNDTGGVETSTCCANTASEHHMMEKLMVDSLVVWAREYKIDSFRFDLMGHHMVSNMEAVREALDALTPAQDGVDGEAIYLYGEGWNFGEVVDNARGENATQFNLAGTGIGTFSDRLRDAVRGGGPFDGGNALISNQGFANGLFYDPNALNSGSGAELSRLLLTTDQIRVGMAGNLATYEFIDRNGNLVTGAQVDYNGQPAGYTADPQENISYVSKHDNQTLYDINAYKMPVGATMEARVRAQAVGLSTVMLGQGVPFIHAGADLLRSKSMDRDSYNSGDWFNRLDFTYQMSNWGVGLPVAEKNQDNWGIIGPLLANPNLMPESDDIVMMAELFQDLLAIRNSSPLFHLQTAAEVQARLAFHNTGPSQLPGLIVMSLSDTTGADLDENYETLVVLINANDATQIFTDAALAGLGLELHPVQVASTDLVVKDASYDSTTGAFSVPGRTTAVFVLPQGDEPPSVIELIEALRVDVQALIDGGQLSKAPGKALLKRLDSAQTLVGKGRSTLAVAQLDLFINQVNNLKNKGKLAAEYADPLIADAEAIIAAIQADLSPAHQMISDLEDDIQALVDGNQLAKNRANPLFAKLDNAQRQLDNNNTERAVKQMQQFISQVESLVSKGQLAEAHGDVLVADAEAIIAEIQSP